MKKGLIFALLGMIAFGAFAQDITLSRPPAKLGIDVLEAIRARAAGRAFVKHDVSVADLSAIAWAGNGLKGTADAVSAASKAGGTIPVSGDVDYVTLYILTAKGVYRYNPAASVLKQVNTKDARADVTTESIATAAFMVLFTMDTSKAPAFMKGNPAQFREIAVATASYGAQNIGLVAAGLRLSTIVMYNVKADAASAAAKMPKEEVPLFIMQVGYTP
jgi:hypothetical protein